MWFSELPFVTSLQVHQGWAFENNVNLIGAGASNPAYGSTGSGIFAGKYGANFKIVSPKPIRKLFVSKVEVGDNEEPAFLHHKGKSHVG